MSAMVFYLLVFALYFNSTISYFLTGTLSHQSYVIAVGVMALIVIIKCIISDGGIISKKVFRVWCVWMLVVVLYFITARIYGYSNSLYDSFGRAVLIQATPTFLVGSIIADDSSATEWIKKLTPAVASVFTIIAFIAAFHPTKTSSGGFASTDYGLDYQTISYMAGYAASLTLYYIFVWDEIEWTGLFKNGIARMGMILTLFVDLLSILISGGRGGLAVFGFVMIFAAWVALQREQISVSTLIKYSVILCIVCVAAFFAIQYAANSSVSTSGFSRIVNAVKNGDSSGRGSIHSNAITAFMDSPVYGHGIGSVYYILGNHAHGIAYDMLVEGGIVGIILLAIFLFYIAQKMLYGFRRNITECLWGFLFLDGFVMSLFSSYYLVQLPMIGALAIILIKEEEEPEL